ncbi:hypothetical protein MBRA_08750 [Mycobacterium branderi]|uniref:Uncharacterized protein n=1 Tax=Mycobacterium branderi TaxID=43348 RepID=A0ABM7KI16_9MYCO|nr:hypothetical protein MBRA_08750 [Mycobacterium branderi]
MPDNRNVAASSYLVGGQLRVVIDIVQGFVGVQIDADTTVSPLFQSMLELSPSQRGLGGAVYEDEVHVT